MKENIFRELELRKKIFINHRIKLIQILILVQLSIQDIQQHDHVPGPLDHALEDGHEALQPLDPDRFLLNNYQLLETTSEANIRCRRSKWGLL